MQPMCARLLARQVAIFVLALGVVLNGIPQAQACPIAAAHQPASEAMAMNMADMHIKQPCSEAAAKSTVDHKCPCKKAGHDCAACMGCSSTMAATQDYSPLAVRKIAARREPLADVHRYGIAIPPSHPPPIEFA